MINNVLNSKRLRFGILDFFYWIPDKLWLKLLFRIKNGYWMDFKHPKTFNEKIQWLKVYGFKPSYTQMVDKYAVKDYVRNKIGDKYIINTIGIWDTPKDIEWAKLPQKFVLKTTHGGGSCGVVICKDKDKIDIKKAIEDLNTSMKFTVGKSFRERPYIGVKKKVIAEILLEEPGGGDLPDYKFYCFNGVPTYCQVIRDRKAGETIDFYDMNWEQQEFVGLNPAASKGKTPVKRPSQLDDMIRVCRELAMSIPFVKIDLYEVNGNVYFGEITFYPASGFGFFSPKVWNIKLGDLIDLRNYCEF